MLINLTRSSPPMGYQWTAPSFSPSVNTRLKSGMARMLLLLITRVRRMRWREPSFYRFHSRNCNQRNNRWRRSDLRLASSSTGGGHYRSTRNGRNNLYIVTRVNRHWKEEWEEQFNDSIRLHRSSNSENRDYHWRVDLHACDDGADQDRAWNDQRIGYSCGLSSVEGLSLRVVHHCSKDRSSRLSDLPLSSSSGQSQLHVPNVDLSSVSLWALYRSWWRKNLFHEWFVSEITVSLFQCPVCECQARPYPPLGERCPQLHCDPCYFGTVKDEYNCDSCICIRPNSQECPVLHCAFGPCNYGSVPDEDDCPTCECLLPSANTTEVNCTSPLTCPACHLGK